MSASHETVMVTGSSGFIGSAVVERLAKEFVIVGLDRPGAPHPPPVAECVDIDLSSVESVDEALKMVRQRHGNHVLSVVHLAAYYDFSGAPSPLYDEITVRGTDRLLGALRREFWVGQFVFSSTMLVHRPCQLGERINEDWPLDPRWPYPQSKVDTERLLVERHGAIPLVLLRIAGVYDDYCHSIPIAHQMQRIYERWMTSRVFPGDTSHGQSFLHLDDLVDAICLTVERRASLPAETTLLLGEPTTLSYDELQHTFGRLLHGEEEWETTEIPKAVAKAGAWVQDALPLARESFIKPWMIDLADDHYALDISRAQRLLGWRPLRSLRRSLPLMAAALRSDPLAWYEAHDLEPPAEIKERAAHAGDHDTHAR